MSYGLTFSENQNWMQSTSQIMSKQTSHKNHKYIRDWYIHRYKVHVLILCISDIQSSPQLEDQCMVLS